MEIDSIRGTHVTVADVSHTEAFELIRKQLKDLNLPIFIRYDVLIVEKDGEQYYEYDEIVQRWKWIARCEGRLE